MTPPTGGLPTEELNGKRILEYVRGLWVPAIVHGAGVWMRVVQALVASDSSQPLDRLAIVW